MEEAGKVYLVGAGPGDPELITRKGLAILSACDVVIYDRLISDELLTCVKESCEKLYVGKNKGFHTLNQEEINRLIIQKAKERQIVVRLKGGDPFVFGRGGEEAQALIEASIPFEVIPGITSAVAAAAYAGIPITQRGVSQSFHVITGHTKDYRVGMSEDFEVLAKLNGTLVFLMGLSNLEEIVDRLLVHGKSPDTPAAVISKGTTREQREARGNLKNIVSRVLEAGIISPAVIIIGEVAGLDMKSPISGPLSHVCIGITGTREFNERLEKPLKALGARVEIIYQSEIIEYQNNEAFETALRSLKTYQWILFTSSNAVNIFFQRMLTLKIDYRTLAPTKFAVIGSKTEQTLLQYGFTPDYKPEVHTGEALAYGLCYLINEKDRLLILRAERGSQDLNLILTEHKIAFDDLKIYDVCGSMRTANQTQHRTLRPDYMVFASASAVHGLMKEAEGLILDTKIVCIGDVTARALREYGVSELQLAKECSINGIISCITHAEMRDDYDENIIQTDEKIKGQ